MSVWIYEGHLGGLYTSDYPISQEDLYCEQCGDSDWEIGCFDTFADFLEYYGGNIAVDEGDSGFDLDFVISSVMYSFEDNLTREEAADIVRAARKEMEEDNNVQSD